MRTILRQAIAAVGVATIVVLAAAAADRAWQTGTWVDVGTKFTPWVGATARAEGATRSIPMPGRPEQIEVGTYIIETTDIRLELQDLVPVGASGSLESLVKIGGPVTFALDGKRTIYIRTGDSGEYRLLVIKKSTKKKL